MFGTLSLPLDEPALVFVVLFFVVLVAPLAARRTRLPAIIGLIVAGVVIGENGIGLVEREGAIALLGGVGLLYLMFQAGVELNLDEFALHRRHALAFGVLGFAVPMIIGTLVHGLLGFEILAALLLASCWASHTLLSYPAFQRMGVVSNRAVAVTVGATIITDTAALMVLAITARAHQGDLDAAFFLTMVPAMTGAAFAIVWVLPRVARWFFVGVGQDRSSRFLFVVVALYASAGLAELAGIEAIVGAFLAGLALNRLISEGSELMNQIEFFGSSFLIPFFLVSVGMLVDPAVVATDPGTLGHAAAFTGVALSGKAAAAWIAGRIFGYERAETGTMFSLSVAQAAATLAAIFVGLQVGLIGEETMNAVVLVILVTCIVSSLSANRFGPQLPRPPATEQAIGRTVLVPISNIDDGGTLLRLGALIAAPDTGTVVPLTVLDFEAGPDEVRELRSHLVETAERAVLANGADARSLVRLDLTPTAGMLHAVVENQATCVLLGWKGWATRRESFFGEQVDAILAASPVPVLVCRPADDMPAQRVVLSVAAGDLTAAGTPGITLATAVAERLAEVGRLPLVVVNSSGDDLPDLFEEAVPSEVLVDDRPSVTALHDLTTPGDVVVVGLSTLRAGLGPKVPRMAEVLQGRTLIAAASR